jgi:phospholipid transport system substrate-binding protein
MCRTSRAACSAPKAAALSKEEFERYYKVVEAYTMAVYEVQLDQFRGEAIKVTGSKDDDARRPKIESLIMSSQTGKDTKVIWDVLASQDGQSYRVRNVGVDVNGSVIWLAQEQQEQFETLLGRNKGDVGKLVVRIKQMIADLETRKKAGSLSTFGKATTSGASPR